MYKTRTWKEIQDAEETLITNGEKRDHFALAIYIVCALATAGLMVYALDFYTYLTLGI